MERFDIYDENRNLTGRTKGRGEKLEEGEFRLVVHVVIFNSKGEMLIQQRQPFKKSWPNFWDLSVGGCAISGETSKQTAQRELFEELGIDLDFSKLRPKITFNFDEAFNDVFIIEKDIDLNDLNLQYEEVQTAKWATEEEVLSLIEEGAFIPYSESYLSLLFYMHKYNGTRRLRKYNDKMA